MSIANHKTVFKRWEDGELTPKEALEELCRQLASVEDTLSGWEQQKQALREQLSYIVETAYQGRAELPWFGRLQISEPARYVRYDSKGIDRLVERLRVEGNTELAEEIESHRKVSGRAGGLSIIRARVENQE